MFCGGAVCSCEKALRLYVCTSVSPSWTTPPSSPQHSRMVETASAGKCQAAGCPPPACPRFPSTPPSRLLHTSSRKSTSARRPCRRPLPLPTAAAQRGEHTRPPPLPPPPPPPPSPTHRRRPRRSSTRARARRRPRPTNPPSSTRRRPSRRSTSACRRRRRPPHPSLSYPPTTQLNDETVPTAGLSTVAKESETPVALGLQAGMSHTPAPVQLVHMHQLASSPLQGLSRACQCGQLCCCPQWRSPPQG